MNIMAVGDDGQALLERAWTAARLGLRRLHPFATISHRKTINGQQSLIEEL